MQNDELDRRDFMKAAGTTAIAGLAAGAISTPARAATEDDLCFASAVELARLIRTKEVSAREVMTAHLARIERLNPRLNAIVAKLDDDECLALAAAADRR